MGFKVPVSKHHIMAPKLATLPSKYFNILKRSCIEIAATLQPLKNTTWSHAE